jgi:indole-3-glycerol phosphate synthase
MALADRQDEIMDLIESIRRKKQDGCAPVIAEIKRIIPKLAAERMRPKDTRPAALLATAYENGGACGISLVTEKNHFGGEAEKDIPAVLFNSSLPLLIKDFFFDKALVDYFSELVNRTGEANIGRITLLLTTHLTREKTPDLLDYIRKRGMTALCETRTPDDLKCLQGVVPKIIGINNKNIDDLEKGEDNIVITGAMVNAYRLLAPGAVLISQSAHHHPRDVSYSLQSGADAVLVGTAFMTASEPEKRVKSFVRATRSLR